MKRIHHYSVFAAVPGGGKQFAIVEGVDNPVEMQRIATESGQPLTGFILNAGAELVEARFFSPTKEKGASDSGALVIGEHLRQLERVGDKLTVQMGDEGLEVFYYDGKWWSVQGTTSQCYPKIKATPQQLKSLSVTLGLDETFFGVAGNLETGKLNAIVEVNSFEALHKIVPNLTTLSTLQTQFGLNGIIAYHEENWIGMRFFSPAKNINEDNAGSFTVASLCGYLAKDYEGKTHVRVIQGEAMGKPSQLFASFEAHNKVAKNIMVGGKVETL